MFFITKKDSETGKKFEAISKKREVCYKAQKAFLKKHKFKFYRPAVFSVFGGISSCSNPVNNTPDPKIWKIVNGDEYMPKLSTKEGKAIHKEIKELPTVSYEELNSCVGFKKMWLSHIGFAERNDTYFGFTAKSSWKIKIPADCEEITETKYNTLFKTGKI